MPEWVLVLVGGAIGGVVSMLLFEGGFMVPAMFTDARGRRHWHPGTAGHVVVGAVAGIVFWALYTPDVSFTSPATVRPVLGSLVAGLVACLGTRARYAREVTSSGSGQAPDAGSGMMRQSTGDVATKNQPENDARRESPDEMLDFFHELRATSNPRKLDQRWVQVGETSKRLPTF